jgi:site-specific DNA-methyltransferase (adenine-specific)
MGAVWTDVSPLNSQAQERLGYPTQKPLALLERIISTSSNKGDLVLDPFCGCGTTVHAAQKLGRRWIGIDITHLAIALVERRLREAFAGIAFETVGVPKDIGAAAALADRDKHEFEKWAISLVPDAQPFRGGRKGADSGIDGVVYFKLGARGTDTGKAIVSVKGGRNIQVSMVRDLKAVVEREKALIGLFLTLAPPTRPMTTEAAAAGFVELDQGRFAKIQILTIAGLLDRSERPQLPVIASPYRAARREEEDTQGDLAL